jgi:hypothetical protein
MHKVVQDNRAMHIVISHAAAPGPRCRAASAALQLSHLQALLPQLGTKTLHTGSPDSLTPLAEQLASGQAYPDGLVPWAAWLAQAQGRYQSGQHWALISPCHLQIHSDHVVMHDPYGLELTEDESRTLMAAMQPYFEEDGIALHWHSATSWLAQGQVFQDLASASLARVRAQPIDPWIPRQSAAQGLRRLQNEMQMLLYTHALNDARSARGLAPVSGFWISGTGAPRPAQGQLLDLLARSAAQDDPQAWCAAWQSLDAGPLAHALARQTRSPEEPLCISLCGTAQGRSYTLGAPSAWQWLAQLWPARRVATYLNDL